MLDAPKCEQPADSGTESGDDLRGSLIVEVQSALDKLSTSLRSDSTDITPERRSSLLQLVTKLQAGLATQAAPPPSERRNSGHGRFARRRTRQNRHTVGVSSEELADARRLMEEIAFRDNSSSITPSTSASRITPSTSTSQCSILQKQNSESSVGQRSPFRPVTIASRKALVKNAIAKPFSNSTSGTSSSVDTPTDPSEALHFLFSMDEPQTKTPPVDATYTETAQIQFRQKKPSVEAFRQSLSFDKDHPQIETKRRPLSHAASMDYSEVDMKSVQQAVQQAAAIKKLERTATVSESTQDDESETEDEDTSTVKQAQCAEDNESVTSPEFFPTPQPQPDLILQANPIYSMPDERNSKETSPEEKYNRFASKKMRMKRANTIDIPKPLNFYEDDDEESDYEQHDHDDERRNNYLALRGPIHVGKLNSSKIVPTFKPKTDSDKKFMAFLNKHNENTANRNNIWCNKVHNWNNRFGNIRTAFEKVAEPEQDASTAKNFWKSADDAVTAGSLTHQGPKISKQSARNLQQMFEEKQKQNEQKKVPWLDTKHVVTGTLKVDTKGFEKHGQQQQPPQSPVRYGHLQPQSPINNFSHAPMSAFKPIEKKTPPPQAVIKPITKPSALTITKSPIVDKRNNSETPLYLYCPKPMYSPTDSQSSSPIPTSKPFLQAGDKKLVNLAASKFEQAAQESQRYKPKNLGVSRGHISNNLQPQTPTTPEKLSAPYLVKSADQTSNVVRKLSNQYDTVGARNDPRPSTQFATVAPTQQLNRSSSVQKPHHYIPNITTTTAKRRQSQPVQTHSHNYVPQYNHPQQFIQPTQTQSKPQMLKQKSLEKDQQQQYTSSFVYKIQKPQETPKQPQQTYQSPVQKYQQPTNTIQKTQPFIESPKISQPPVSFDRQTSQDNYREYTAPMAKVMTGPVSQQAVTVRQKSPMSRDQHEMDRAVSLRNTLQKTTQHNNLSSGSFKTPYERQKTSKSPSPGPQQYRNEPRAPPNYSFNDDSVTRSNANSVVAGKFHIPVVNVLPGTPTTVPTQAQVLSKSDSWHQICQQFQPPPQGSQNLRPVKSKSSHTLAVPKLFEAGMSKDEMVQKRQTVEAFFSGSKSPPSLSKSNSRESIDKDGRKTSINRMKTSQKISIHKEMIGGMTGISRSRTLPDIVCPDMLDESNVDKAFEELFRSSS